MVPSPCPCSGGPFSTTGGDALFLAFTLCPVDRSGMCCGRGGFSLSPKALLQRHAAVRQAYTSRRFFVSLTCIARTGCGAPPPSHRRRNQAASTSLQSCRNLDPKLTQMQLLNGRALASGCSTTPHRAKADRKERMDTNTPTLTPKYKTHMPSKELSYSLCNTQAACTNSSPHTLLVSDRHSIAYR